MHWGISYDSIPCDQIAQVLRYWGKEGLAQPATYFSTIKRPIPLLGALQLPNTPKTQNITKNWQKYDLSSLSGNYHKDELFKLETPPK